MKVMNALFGKTERCPICLEKRRPKGMQKVCEVGHSVCKTCAIVLYSTGAMACPLCRDALLPERPTAALSL